MIALGAEYDWAGALPIVDPEEGHTVPVLDLGTVCEDELLTLQGLNTEPRQQRLRHHGMSGTCVD